MQVEVCRGKELYGQVNVEREEEVEEPRHAVAVWLLASGVAVLELATLSVADGPGELVEEWCGSDHAVRLFFGLEGSAEVGSVGLLERHGVEEMG